MFITNKVYATNKISGIEYSDKFTEKYRKLSKIRKLSKFQNLFKSQKSAKSRKKLSINGNLPIFDNKKNWPCFLTLKTKVFFNNLWLIFTKTSSF